MPSVQTILILASNPSNSNRLRLDEEIREIQDVLRNKRDLFEVEPRLATRIDDIQQALLDYEPQIVHFCGHGEGGEGLVFEDNTGHSQAVSSRALANLFELCADTVKCVVLNACYSEIQAKAITTHIDTVIGMRQAIGDRAAIAFSKGFYRGLGAGKDIEFAYKLGRNSLELQSIPEAHVPVFIRRCKHLTYPVLPNVPKQEPSSQLKQPSELIEISDKANTVVKVSTVSLTGSLTKIEKAKESQKKGMRSWECVQTLSQELGSSVVLSTPDSKFIIIGSQKNIKILNSITRETAHTFEDIERKISALAISSDSQYLMSGGYDKTISIWDLKVKQLKKKIPSNISDTKGLGNITSIACSSDCRYIYTGDTRGVARAWNVDSGECIFNISCHSSAIGKISLNATYNWLATCGDDKKVRLIDLNKTKIFKRELKDSDRIQTVDFSSDDNFLIYAGDSGNVHLYDVRTWENSIFYNQNMPIKSVVISPSNNYFFCAGLNKTGQGSIKLWKLSPTSKRAIRTLKGHKGAVGSLAITPNGKTLISGSNDQTVKIWEGNFDDCFGSSKTVTINQPTEISESPKVLDENLESYISHLEKVLFQKKRFTLKADHNALIRGAYYRKSYAQIAAESGFAETYLKSKSGDLWKLLSDILKVKVDKQSVRKLVQAFAKK